MSVGKGIDKRAMAVLSAGHLFTDVNQGAVAATRDCLQELVTARIWALAPYEISDDW